MSEWPPSHPPRFDAACTVNCRPIINNNNNNNNSVFFFSRLSISSEPTRGGWVGGWKLCIDFFSFLFCCCCCPALPCLFFSYHVLHCTSPSRAPCTLSTSSSSSSSSSAAAAAAAAVCDPLEEENKRRKENSLCKLFMGANNSTNERTNERTN